MAAEPSLTTERKDHAPAEEHVIAPRKARRHLQGESPCREELSNEFLQGLATHPYRALDPWRSCLWQRTRWVKRRQRIL
jgi:hypothetical protein